MEHQYNYKPEMRQKPLQLTLLGKQLALFSNLV